jgi:hypothetical protein
MGMTNSEKQAAWRARQAANARRVVDLEEEVARLKAELAAGASKDTRAKSGGLVTGHRLFDDIDAKAFEELVEQQICDGKASPSAVYQLGGNLQRLGEAYWGRDGKFGPRKAMAFDQKVEAIQRRRDAAKKRQAKMFAKG